MNNFYINIYEKSTDKSWKEEFDSYYLFKKRYNKLRFSNKLIMRGHSSLVD